MNFFEILIVNIAFLFKWIWHAINASPVLSSLVSAIIIGGFLVYIFRIPNFSMSAYAKLNAVSDGSLFFETRNEKRFMAYDADDVFFKIYVPERLFMNGEFTIERQTLGGWEVWDPLHNFRDKDRFEINSETYILINGISRMPLFPEQATALFLVNGNFAAMSGEYRIFYQFRTRYGFYPSVVRGGYHNWFLKRFRGKQQDVIAGKLPSVILNIP